MSQRDLAAVGTTRHQIIRYEGAERPEIGRLTALARACSVTVADLLDEDALPQAWRGCVSGAGLTMAAAATALSEHIDPSTGIATNRASLSARRRAAARCPGGGPGRFPCARGDGRDLRVDIDAVRSCQRPRSPTTRTGPRRCARRPSRAGVSPVS